MSFAGADAEAMTRSSRYRLLVAAFLMLPAVLPADAQEHPNSPVLRSYVPPATPSLVKHFNEAERIWEDFMLVKKANEGDPLAEHELGLRYFFGQGFLADTEKAADWIRRAADQNLAPARYNLGIMENNGWGVAWNPFAAYLDFRAAAEEGIPDAEYAVGTFLTDNLVVPRDEHEAYCWVEAAADSGYTPAIQLLDEFNKKGYGSSPGSQSGPEGADTTAASSAFGLVYIDFSSDTVKRPSDTTLVEDLKENAGERGKDLVIKPAASDSVSPADTTPVPALRELANAGSPEAMTLLGRWHDRETGRNSNLLQATVDYLRAVRLGSPHAAQLLWELVHRPGYFEMLKKEVDAKLPEAEFAWAGLTAYSFDQQLTDRQALQLLNSSAASGNIQAMIELGLCYASGRWVRKDPAAAVAWWKRATALGSREAEIRRLVAGIMGAPASTASAATVDSLSVESRDGSVLAETALAYCYERGLGVRRDVGEAVRLYRKSARRGSRAAFDELKKLYDDLRPNDPEFAIED